MNKKHTVMICGALLLSATIDCHAANWVKINFDVPNKNVQGTYYDGKSVKVKEKEKVLTWTEKTVLTDFGAKYYAKHLQSFPACKEAMEAKGEVSYHQLDLEIKDGKFRTVAKRNYNKKNELLCTDKDMGKELNSSWKPIKPNSPIYNREYELATKYKIGDI